MFIRIPAVERRDQRSPSYERCKIRPELGLDILAVEQVVVFLTDNIDKVEQEPGICLMAAQDVHWQAKLYCLPRNRTGLQPRQRNGPWFCARHEGKNARARPSIII